MSLLGVLILFYISISLSAGNGNTVNDFPVKVNHFSQYLGTKTPYRFISNIDDSPITFDGCKSTKIWMIVRHGTRYPSQRITRAMKETLPLLCNDIVSNLRQGKGELPLGILTNISAWSPQADVIDAKRLAHEGEDELLELAERFQNRFPHLLVQEYSNSTYKFRSTDTQRTKESLRYFTIGLFGRRVAKYVWTPKPLHKDPILRFYKACEKWQKEVNKNPVSLTERKMFEKSHLTKMVVSNISRRLGFDNDISLEDIKLMHVTCGFESAWYRHHTSPWCHVFTERELEVLDYAEDLEYYWVDGYGYGITYLQACNALKDMFHHLTLDDGPTGTFYFTHSGSLLKILAHLGLYKDSEKLTHKNFSSKRLWKAGLIDTFATNLAFVLFHCKDGPKLLTLHQERPVILPGCETELCPLEVITKIYHETFFNCRFDEMCRL